MDASNVSALLRDLLTVTLKVGGPMLILSMVVGVVIAIFQAVTQIHEQTIAFIFKVVVIIVVLLLGGGWMMETLVDFTRSVFLLIAA